MLFVRHGFTTAPWDPPRFTRRQEIVSVVETATISFTENLDTCSVNSFGNVNGLLARYRDDGEIMVYNRGKNYLGFAICQKCGYCDSEKRDYSHTDTGAVNLPNKYQYHAALYQDKQFNKCWSDGIAQVWRGHLLAAREKTDVLLLDFSGVSGSAVCATDSSIMYALAFSMQRAVAQLLELDIREVGVDLVPTGPAGKHFGITLFDNVPGGAGHVAQLLRPELQNDLLVAAKDRLFVDERHNNNCLTGCLDCVLSFETQRRISSGLFKRREAYDFIRSLI